MIIYSQTITFDAASEIGPNNSVIGYINYVTLANITATYEDADFPVTNLANPATDLKWVGGYGFSPEADQFVTVVTGTANDLDYLGVVKHNFSSAGIAVSVEGFNGSWIELTDPTIPNSDGPLVFRFNPQPFSQVRLRMVPGTAAPQAAVMYVGLLLALPRKIYVGHVPIPYGRSHRVTNNRSESGHFLGRIITGASVESSVAVKHIPPAYYRDNLDAFIRAAVTIPFFFAWRPFQYPDEVGYAWLTVDPRPMNSRNTGNMEMELSMGGVT